MRVSASRFAFAALFLLICNAAVPARGQLARETIFTGQPLIYVEGGKLNGCGVRVVVADPAAVSGKADIGIFASMQLFRNTPQMIVKVDAARLVIVNGKADIGAHEVVERAWFRTDGAVPTKAFNGKISPSDDGRGGIFYISSDFANDLKILMAAVAGRSIDLGMKLKSESDEIVLFGTVTISDAESRRIQSCLTDMLADVKK